MPVNFGWLEIQKVWFLMGLHKSFLCLLKLYTALAIRTSLNYARVSEGHWRVVDRSWCILQDHNGVN